MLINVLGSLIFLFFLMWKINFVFYYAIIKLNDEHEFRIADLARAGQPLMDEVFA